MASWTPLTDIKIGELVTSENWNQIFGPDGNQAFLKPYADQLTNDYYKEYYVDFIRIQSGWPQGNPDNYANGGNLTYMPWIYLGIPEENSTIKITEPAKYLGIFWCSLSSIYAGSNTTPNPSLSSLKVLIYDTSGSVNIQHYYQSFSPSPAISFTIPFIIDVKFETEITVAMVAIQDFSDSTSANSRMQWEIYDGKISFHKLPMKTSEIIPTTSFILGSSTLNGTSNF